MVALSACIAIAALSSPQSNDINDAQINSALNQFGEVIASDQTSNAATLQSQLNRTQATITLPKPPAKIAEENLYTEAKKASVIFASFGLCGNCEKFHPNPASGFIISPDGLVVTNYHVINNPEAKAFAIMTSEGKIHRVTEVLAASKTADVAIVKVDAKNLPYLPIRPNANPGITTYVLSHPKGNYYTFTKGILARYFIDRDTRWAEITADYAGGSSGGPVMDANGAIVGVVSMTQSVYYGGNKNSDLQMVRKICVPSSAILNLIKN